MKPKAIDLFCGCGGTTQGLKEAGFDIIAGVEINRLAVETYRKNHPKIKIWTGDIRDIAAMELMHYHRLKPGDLDLLVGCPPCQSFSSMPRLNGHRRIRSKDSKDLIFEYLRFVCTLLPKVICLENVPRLVQDHRFKKIRRVLRKLGYKGRPGVFNAADYGVPQRRKRMIFIASRIGWIGYAQGLAEDARINVKQAIGWLPSPGHTGDQLHDFPEARSEKVRHIIAMIPRDGGSRSALKKTKQLKCHRKCDGFSDVYGRMAWNEVAPTITSGCVNPSKGRFLHPSENRSITLREAALLQSFPLNYYFSLRRGKFAAAEMIGNAFPPQLVKLHVRQITRYFQESMKRSVQSNECAS